MDSNSSWRNLARPSTTPSVDQTERIIIIIIIKITKIKIEVQLVIVAPINKIDHHLTQSQTMHLMHRTTRNEILRTKAKTKTTIIGITILMRLKICYGVTVMSLVMKTSMKTWKMRKPDTLPSSTQLMAIHEAVQTELDAPLTQQVQILMARPCSVPISKEKKIDNIFFDKY